MTRTLDARERANRELIAAVYEEVLKPLDSGRVDDFFAPGYIQHNPMAETGADGLKRFLDWAKAMAPGATHDVKRILVDGDFVVGHVHVVVNPGERGRTVVDIFRIENGRVAEHWDSAQEIPSESANTNGMF